MSSVRRLAGIHLQRERLFSALRATAAALTGYLLALACGLECPYWAAMTALIVIQPTRGLLFEKSLYRLVGTATGALAGLALLHVTRSELMLTVALALWVGGCVGIGNLLYSMRSYACMMAGMTCAVVVMSGFLNPLHLNGIALGRVGDVFIGIVAATLLTALSTPRQSRDEIGSRLETVTATLIGWLAELLREGRSGPRIDQEQNLLIEIAAIEGELERIGAGSIRFKQHKRRYQQLIASQLSLMALGRYAATTPAAHNPPGKPWTIQLSEQLAEVADKISRARSIHCLDEMRATVRELKASLPVVGDMREELVSALHAVLNESGHLHGAELQQRPSRRHLCRNGREALRAAVRAALAISAVGLVWTLFEWRQGPMMLMAMSIMLSIFSSKEHPVAFVGQIFIGAAIGTSIAVGVRLVILPEINQAVIAGLVLTPMIFLGTYAMACRRTAIGATDATLFFIFVSQPGTPVTIMPVEIVLAALAMVLGVGSAWLSYRFLVPVNPRLRLRSLLMATHHDLAALATVPQAGRRTRLQARIHHRVIRLVAMANQFDHSHRILVEGALAALAASSFLCHQPPQNPGADFTERSTHAPTPVSPAFPDEALALFHSAISQWFKQHQLHGI